MTAWLDMRPAHFGQTTPTVAEPLFAAPDSLGTPDLLTECEDSPTSNAQNADLPAEPFAAPVAAPIPRVDDDQPAAVDPAPPAVEQPPTPAPITYRPHVHDERFTMGLMYDVLKVLESHGYQAPEGAPAVYARSMVALGKLVRVFEGGELDL